MTQAEQTIASLPDAYLALAKLLRILEAQGYRAPLSRELDLLHDFVSTEWAPMVSRLDGRVPRRYLVTAFCRFVRRRVVEERRQCALLVQDTDARGVSHHDPKMTLTASAVRRSLDALGPTQQQLLVDRYIRELSERELATARRITRHELRQRLVEAIAAFVVLQSESDSFPVRVAKALFVEGLPIEAAAASLNVSAQRVRAGRDAFLDSLRKERV